MQWRTQIADGGRRPPAVNGGLPSRLLVPAPQMAQPASWWHLCSLLSGFQVRHGSIRPLPELWSELLPFLLIRDERLALRAVDEYLVYLHDPSRADLCWLGLRINEALERVDDWNEAIADVLDHPASALDARWMALLSFQSLLRLRKAVVLYGSDLARTGRHLYWHGMRVSDGSPARLPSAGASIAVRRKGEGLARRRLRLDARLDDGGFRRFQPRVPTSLS